MIKAQRWQILAAGLLVESFCGVSYVFGTVSETYKTKFDLSQDQTSRIGALSNAAGYTGLHIGLIYDRYGPKPLFLGSTALSLAFFTTWALVQYFDKISAPATYLSVLYFLQGHAMMLGDIAVLSTLVRLFPKNKGRAVGIAKSFGGLSGSLLNQFYYLTDSVSYLLLFIASGFFLVNVAAFFVFNRETPRDTLVSSSYNGAMKAFKRGYSGIIVLILIILGSALLNDEFSLLLQSREILSVTVVSCYVCVVLYMATRKDKEESAHTFDSLNEDRAILDQPLLPESEETREENELERQEKCEFTLFQAMQTKLYWLMVVSLFIVVGSGLMLIVNLGQLIYVVGLQKKHKVIYVTMLSLFNCGGRLLMGISSDLLFNRYGLRRLVLFGCTLFFMSTAMLAISSGTQAGLFIGTIIGGLSYGAVFTVVPPLVR
mmetsp:Transcript_2658/g.3087  ORF Transcript_2658/g.3087 Transcript_2658/m.3087 type:complete len:431 (-) Transcript_2658:723-2015(-)